MAGHRRTAGKPFRAETRAANRRELFTDRMGRARTPGQRVSAATDYLTGTLSDVPPGEANALASEAVDALVSLVERAEQITRRRKSR